MWQLEAVVLNSRGESIKAALRMEAALIASH